MKEGEPQDDLQSRVDKIKNSESYKKEFGTPEMATLTQAIDILIALRKDASHEGHDVAWQKLQDAVKYLEVLQKEHLEKTE
jgi:hypothetical protein